MMAQWPEEERDYGETVGRCGRCLKGKSWDLQSQSPHPHHGAYVTSLDDGLNVMRSNQMIVVMLRLTRLAKAGLKIS